MLKRSLCFVGLFGAVAMGCELRVFEMELRGCRISVMAFLVAMAEFKRS